MFSYFKKQWPNVPEGDTFSVSGRWPSAADYSINKWPHLTTSQWHFHLCPQNLPTISSTRVHKIFLQSDQTRAAYMYDHACNFMILFWYFDYAWTVLLLQLHENTNNCQCKLVVFFCECGNFWFLIWVLYSASSNVCCLLFHVYTLKYAVSVEYYKS